jgi:S-adenosylmethionine decarboxylase
MDNANLFQLGIGLATGAQAEDIDCSNAAARNEYTQKPNHGLKLVTDEARDDHFIRRDGKVFAGTHLIIEVVDGKGLDDEDLIQSAFRRCVDECGATLLHIHTHKFSPQGVSGVAVLAESHISVHTWPEIGYAAFDVFMCGDAQPWNAVGVLADAFDTNDIRVRELLRGDGVVGAML